MKTTFTDGAIEVTETWPGDFLVFKVQGVLDVEAHERCRKAIKAMLPEDMHFIVVDRRMDVGVVRPVLPFEPTDQAD